MLRVPPYTVWMVAVFAALSVPDSARSQCPVNSIFDELCNPIPSAAPSATAACGSLQAFATASYDVVGGFLGIDTSASSDPNGGGALNNGATTVDDYVVLGALPVGTPISIRARLTVREWGTYCGGLYHGAWGMIQEGETNSASVGGCESSWPVEIVINSFIGTSMRISCSLSGFVSGAGSESADAVLTFLDLPAGCAITSCQGYSQSAVTAVAGGVQTRLDLKPLGANPSSGTFALAVTLPDDSPARVALYDLSGRLITSVDLGGAGAGRHTVRFGADKALAAGVYYARLTQGARSTQRTQVVVR